MKKIGILVSGRGGNMEAMRAARLPLTRTLLIAFVLSVTVHLLVVFGHRINLRTAPEELPRLEVVLARTAPEQKPEQAPMPVKPPRKAVSAPKAAEPPQTPAAEAEVPQVEAPPPPLPTEPEPKAEPPPQAEVPPAPAAAPKVVGNAWPRAGLIRYFLFGGESRDPADASTAELHWEIAPDGRYSMKLESADIMPFRSLPFIKISFSYASQGMMIDGNFHPDRYEEALSVFHNAVVDFDWAKGQVSFAGRRVPLVAGTQDYLSVIMQAGDPGFVDKGVVSVATGRGLRQYRFESLGEAELALPSGMTWKTRRLVGKTGNNDVQVWVATEKFNLPVQIRFVANKVDYYLVANEVRVGLATPAADKASGLPGATTAAPANPPPDTMRQIPGS